MSDKEQPTNICCRTCCYWSELIAKTHGGLLLAMCLAANAPRAWRYRCDDAGCLVWEEVRNSAIDDSDTGEMARMQLPGKAP